MKDIIEQIISDLTSSEERLPSALMKAKVLAYQLKNDAFLTWVNNEVGGYKDGVSPPDYRMVQCIVKGTLSNGRYYLQNQVIPIRHVEKTYHTFLTKVPLHFSVESLFHLIEGAESDSINSPLEPEFVAYILNKQIPFASGMQIQIAHRAVSISLIKNTISTIKSKLLDFVLELQKTESESPKGLKKNKINELVTLTITGNNNVVITGDKNVSTITIEVNKGDLNSVKDALKSAGVKQEDITQLVKILPNENLSVDGKYGIKLSTWYGKMMAKASDGGWQIGLGAAGSLLAEIIAKYYGI